MNDNTLVLVISAIVATLMVIGLLLTSGDPSILEAIASRIQSGEGA